MTVAVLELGNVYVSRTFLCGDYMYGYASSAGTEYMVRYDYVTCTWSVACLVK